MTKDVHTADTGAGIIAADPSQSVWVAANAGTGKTYLLINRVARLLLAGTPPAKILCLTFTRAAAAEMINRLNTLLGRWSTAAEPDLRDEIGNLVGSNVSGDMIVRARRLFALTLDAPGGLKIQTIHAFCESLLGRFPLEAGIAPHFSLMDERTAAELLADVRDRVLANAFDPAADDQDMAHALDHMAGLVDEQGFAAIMAEVSFNKGRLARLIDTLGGSGGDGLAQLIRAARRALGLGPHEDAQAIIADGVHHGAFDEAGLKGAAKALKTGAAADRERAAGLGAWMTDDDSGRAAGFDSYALLFLTQKDEPRKKLISAKTQAAHPGAIDILLAEQTRVLDIKDRLKSAFVAQATEAMLLIGTTLMNAYQEAKERNALLDYDDLIHLARSLLANRAATQWVLYKLDGGLDHILLDEAQDTSLEQWKVAKALCEEFFSGEGTVETTRTLFVVGDEKQSIYSFQGADPDAFETMRAYFSAQVTGVGQIWNEVELAQSRRSVPALLSLFDHVFAPKTPAAVGLTATDTPIRHLPFRMGQAGWVELWPTLTPDEQPDANPWDAPLDQLSLSSPEVRLAARIADTIGGWLENKEPLESAGRPMEAGDIMILVRTRTRFVDEMVRALKTRGIPVAGTDRMVLTDQLAIMDLTALGHAVLLPDDDLNLATVLKSPLIGFDDDDLYELAYGRDGGLWKALEKRVGDKPIFQSAHDTLSRLRRRADFTPPYEFFATLLGEGGARRALLQRLGHDAGDPLDEFLALALQFEHTHPPSLQGFLHWLEAGGAEIKRDLEHGRGEVRVMTVHGSKGLEANVVFLPDTCTTPAHQHGSKLLWRTDGEEEDAVLWPVVRANEGTVCTDLREAARNRVMAEYRRLLYVAMTRARDRLYVCGWETKKGRAEGCWYDLIEGPLKDKAEEITLPSGATVWRVASRQTAPPEKKGPAAAHEAPSPLPPWAGRAPAAEPEPARPLAPSRDEGDEPPVLSPLADDGVDRFKRGRLIHRLLQSLPEVPIHARAKAAQAFLSRPAHGLAADQRDAIAAETMAVLDATEFAPLFGPGSRAEVPIAGVVGERVISGQVDRLLITDEAVMVIDYKTNRPPPETVAGIADIYLRQMAAYRAVLALIYPDRPVHCVLLWTDGPRVMTLPDPLLDRFAP